MPHRLLLLLTAAGATTAKQWRGSWRDGPPVAASAIKSLDGNDWWVEGHGRAFSHNCTGGGPSSRDDAGCAVCKEGANYSAPAVGPHGWYSVESLGMGASWTQSDCVELCAATSDCAAAVWTAPVHGHPVGAAGTGCGFRTVAEVAQGTWAANGTTACVPTALRNIRVSIPATVPGDLVTDLQRAGKVLDPLSSSNHKDPSQVQWWNGVSYTYSKNFSVTAAIHAAASVRLVLSSVKMGATVGINGHTLGNTTNQFLRYMFDIGPFLTSGQNTLSVRFDRSIDTGGRFMAASGGWDWAPYSRMRDRGGRLEWTRGIVGSVYLAATAVGTVAIDHLSPTILYKGMFPTSMLKDDGTHTFEVNVTTHLAAKADASGTLTVTGDWGGPQSIQSVAVPVAITAADNGTKAVSVIIEARRVKLWWPRGMGMGRPVLYNVSAQFVPSAVANTLQGYHATDTAVTASRRIGFRTAYLTTGNDTDEAWVAANSNGNGYRDASTVMFRINGVPTVMRGGNLIPMESMEGRYVEGMHRQLVKSAAEANMNMLR
jgi:beta-mannosidase